MASADVIQAREVVFNITFTDAQTVPHTGVFVKLREHERVTTIGEIFGSMELLSVTASLDCAPLPAGSVRMAFVPDLPNFTMNNGANEAVMGSALHSQMRFFSQNDPVRFAITLSSDHSFGRELKALNLGNQPPVLAVRFTNLDPATTGQIANLSLRVKLRVANASPEYHFD